MNTYVGELVSTYVSINNIRFTNEVIMDILQKQPVVPVTINFAGRSIGCSKRFFLADDRLLAEFSIDAQFTPEMMEASYVVPGLTNVQFVYEGRTRVITSADLNELSISLLPADPHVKPIQLKGE